MDVRRGMAYADEVERGRRLARPGALQSGNRGIAEKVIAAPRLDGRNPSPLSPQAMNLLQRCWTRPEDSELPVGFMRTAHASPLCHLADLMFTRHTPVLGDAGRI